jgi:hypothetical protein
MKAHKNDNGHVSKIKVRERSYLQKEYSSPYSFSSHTFHTHAHLDLRVRHFSFLIIDLTLQYMQYKYAALFIPT